jgi:hypothetical protein
MRAVDDALLAALRAIDADDLKVYDGYLGPVERDPLVPTKIEYPLPYVVFYSNIGDDHSPRLDGRSSRRSVFFQITYVGEDRRQAKWAGEKVRQRLEGQRIEVPGHRTYLVDLQLSERVRRDDNAISATGKPLFYGVDEYALSVTRTHQEVA